MDAAEAGACSARNALQSNDPSGWQAESKVASRIPASGKIRDTARAWLMANNGGQGRIPGVNGDCKHCGLLVASLTTGIHI